MNHPNSDHKHPSHMTIGGLSARESLPLFEAPQPVDFELTEGMLTAARQNLPNRHYDPYRHRVMQEFNLKREPGLRILLAQVMHSSEFMGAYFHPVAGAQTTSNGQNRHPVALQDWPYRLAMSTALSIRGLPELDPQDEAMARVAVFMAPLGTLRMWDIVERGGESPLRFYQSRYGHAYSRHVRSLVIGPVLQHWARFDREVGSVLGALLLQPPKVADLEERLFHKTQRIAALMAWCDVLRRDALTQRGQQNTPKPSL